MAYTSFDKKSLNILRDELLKVLREHGPEGLEFNLGNIKFSSGDCSIDLKVKIEGAKTRTENMLEMQVAALGLKMVNTNGWKLVDYKPSNYAYPFIYENAGKRFKCSTQHAKMFFKV